ncbi:hypothetical protein D3C72_1057800 [compost metagenome]
MTACTTTWHAETGLLVTRLTGTVSAVEVTAWRDGLHAAIAGLPDGARFKLLYDLVGYEPAELAAHKAMREVVPRLLAAHGMRPAVTDLFDDAPEPEVTATRGIRCAGFANVHHDPAKMARYEAEVGRPDQRFFTDAAEAERWLLGLAPTAHVRCRPQDDDGPA